MFASVREQPWAAASGEVSKLTGRNLLALPDVL
jgi:hypothetical protein